MEQQQQQPHTKPNFHCIHSNRNKKNKIHSEFTSKTLLSMISILVTVSLLLVLYVSVLHISPYTLFKDTTFWFIMSNSIIIIVAADSGVFSSSTAASAKSSRSYKAYDVYDEYILHARATLSLPSTTHQHHDKDEHTKARDGHVSNQQQQEEVENEDKRIVLYEKSTVVKEQTDTSIHSSNSNSVVVQKKSADYEKSLVLMNEVKYERKPTEVTNYKEKRIMVHQKSFPADHSCKGSGNEASTEKSLRRSARTEKQSRFRSVVEENDEYSKMSNEELNKRVEDFIKRFNREIRFQMRNNDQCF